MMKVFFNEIQKNQFTEEDLIPYNSPFTQKVALNLFEGPITKKILKFVNRRLRNYLK